MNFLYFGRLDKEKWFEAILETIAYFWNKDKNLPFEIFIFGKGELEKEILNLTSQYKQIHFFGRQDLQTIKRYVENCSFTLVPSEFLETFGLSALNSLSWWLPVVWYKKWWLEPFIFDEWNLYNYDWKNTTEKLINLIEKISKSEFSSKIESLKQKSLELSKKYTTSKWIENFEKLIYNSWKHKIKKILMISDFSSKLWWIETFLYDTQKILWEKCYEVEIIWKKIPHWALWKIAKIVWIFLGVFNIFFMIRIKFFIKKSKPDLIWFHSTLRRIGWLWIFWIHNYDCPKRLMLHDLWYFFPFPSKLYELNQIKYPFTYKHFIKSTSIKNPLIMIALTLKYLSLKLLKKSAKKHIDKFLVPSAFMEKIVEKSYKIPENKIQTMNLFLQE